MPPAQPSAPPAPAQPNQIALLERIAESVEKTESMVRFFYSLAMLQFFAAILGVVAWFYWSHR